MRNLSALEKMAFKKAREAWESTDEFKRAMDTGILFSPHQVKYLRNRLLMAFDAGWMAAEAQRLQEPK